MKRNENNLNNQNNQNNLNNQNNQRNQQNNQEEFGQEQNFNEIQRQNQKQKREQEHYRRLELSKTHPFLPQWQGDNRTFHYDTQNYHNHKSGIGGTDRQCTDQLP